jgi:hypothetical protein
MKPPIVAARGDVGKVQELGPLAPYAVIGVEGGMGWGVAMQSSEFLEFRGDSLPCYGL